MTTIVPSESKAREKLVGLCVSGIKGTESVGFRARRPVREGRAFATLYRERSERKHVRAL
jgi:hypothetical protein